MTAGASGVTDAAQEYRFAHESITLRWSAATDTGRKRTTNEDSVFASFPVLIVADGMGGHDAGDVASSRAVEAFAELKGTSLAQIEQVERSVAKAFEAVSSEPRSGDRAGGTTLAGAVLVDVEGEPHWLVVNVGDSRTYLLVDGELEQVSVDHSLVQELIDAGAVDEEQARSHPDRGVITRALGAGQEHAPDFWLLPAERGQRLLVCSDGLTGEVDDVRLRGILAATPSPADAASSLIAVALDAGGRDNVTVIVADVDAVRGDATFGDTARPARAAGGDTEPLAWSGSELDDDTVPTPRRQESAP